MDQKPKTFATSPPPLQPHPPKCWLNRIKTFLEVPNPRIVRIFLISSFATFASDIAFAFEWAFHGKNQTGFQWIIYYALSLIFCPVLIWLGLGIGMAVSSRHGSTQVAISAVKEDAGRGGTKDSNCRSLAVVVDPTNKKCIGPKIFEGKSSKLKRSASFPLHSKVRSCRTR
ncbi:hypothetical protein EUTSA_v10027568mg [Eutrema salsugineum]|uniref:Uncharacterized protein n=1 Tax=Eutrema salsugineum TaxID=72664 RepID=V4MKD8_EUTSA|nr:uncharacterized protein LOC18028399 [Eutrema salsugineum]ESQ53133.1 hypothetical protein EUTSA_v10027568mg [Eutrema salsugineum]